MPDVIAKRELLGVHQSGERFPIIIEICRPESQGDVNDNWRCSVSVTPLCHRPSAIGGYDALQALALAISFAHSELADFAKRGGRLLYPDSKEEFSLSEPFLSCDHNA
jgi:hypothetical protein